jgi:thiol-disulfide isomerase/thioredoxin
MLKSLNLNKNLTMNYKTINSLEESLTIIKEHKGVLLFFSTLKCSLGEALEPKIFQLLQNHFPEIPFYFIDMNSLPTISAHYGIFVEPTILVFFDGKETIRKSRHINVKELSIAISRIYKIIFK